MKIINLGNAVICEVCKCVFEYEKEDVQTSDYARKRTSLFSNKAVFDKWRVYYVECPHCGKKIEIHSIELKEDENHD